MITICDYSNLINNFFLSFSIFGNFLFIKKFKYLYWWVYLKYRRLPAVTSIKISLKIPNQKGHHYYILIQSKLFDLFFFVKLCFQFVNEKFTHTWFSIFSHITKKTSSSSTTKKWAYHTISLNYLVHFIALFLNDFSSKEKNRVFMQNFYFDIWHKIINFLYFHV